MPTPILGTIFINSFWTIPVVFVGEAFHWDNSKNSSVRQCVRNSAAGAWETKTTEAS